MNPIVYVLHKCFPYEGCETLGVFSSIEAAEAFAEEQEFRMDLFVAEFELNSTDGIQKGHYLF